MTAALVTLLAQAQGAAGVSVFPAEVIALDDSYTVTLRLRGEPVPGVKRLASYSPAAGDQVWVLSSELGMVVIGKEVNPPIDPQSLPGSPLPLIIPPNSTTGRTFFYALPLQPTQISGLEIQLAIAAPGLVSVHLTGSAAAPFTVQVESGVLTWIRLPLGWWLEPLRLSGITLNVAPLSGGTLRITPL